MPQNFVAIHSTSYKVLTQCTVLRIQCVDRDEAMDGRGTEAARMSDESHTDVGWKSNRHGRKIGWTWDGN